MNNYYSKKADLQISLVIPVFNEEDNLRNLYARITPVMEKLNKSYELLFVDDGSTDRSFRILKELKQKDTRVKIIKFTRNFGQHAALSAGFRKSKGDIVIQMDADLQNPPEEIPRLLKKQEEGYDVVFGIRANRQDSFYRKTCSKVIGWMLKKFISKDAPVNTGAFKVMNRAVVDALNQCHEKSRFTSGLTSWLGFSQTGIEIEHAKRTQGKSKYNFFKLLMLTFDLITGFSYLPLRIASFLGFIFSLIGLSMGGFIFFRKIFTDYYILGYPSIIVAILFFSGIQLVCLGVIGEYLARVYRETQGRPMYVIQEILEPEE